MFVEKLILQSFKNISDAVLECCPSINLIVGANGAGKTNLLDGIYCILFGKSALGFSDTMLINHDATFYRLEANVFKLDKSYRIELRFGDGQKKTIWLDGKPHEKLSHHLGLFPILYLDPDGVDLIREGSEFRRKYFDILFSQHDKAYLEVLMEYNHILKQRNAVLKTALEQKKQPDAPLLEVYDSKIISLCQAIYRVRAKFITEILPLAVKSYAFLSQKSQEVIHIHYQSDCGDATFELQYKKNISRDIALGRTELGIHTDDYIFYINNREIKKYASQGQRKSFLLALKFAEMDYFKQNKGFYPIFLLDDIFDKLDDTRVARMLALLQQKEGLQVFITNPSPERAYALLKKNDFVFKSFMVDAGNVTPMC